MLSIVTWKDIATCADKEASIVQTAAKEATPVHDSVPWVVVDGTSLSSPRAELFDTICAAYIGPTPASCIMRKKQQEQHQ